MTNAVNLASAAGTGFAFRNRIINGDMKVAQRGTSISVGSNNTVYTLDRWIVFSGGSAITASQVSGISLSGYDTALSISGSSGNTQSVFGQRIESHNIKDLAGTPVTVSGWVFSSAAVTPSLNLSYPNATDTFTTSTLFSTSSLPNLTPNTWTYFSITVTLNALVTRGLLVEVVWGATGSGVARYLTGVQVEAGSVATPFERRPFGLELQLAQRYFQWVPFTAGFTSNGNSHFLQFAVPLAVQMRTVPSFSSLSADPNAAQVAINNGSNAFAAAYSSINSAFGALTANTAGSCQAIGYRAQANAEL